MTRQSKRYGCTLGGNFGSEVHCLAVAMSESPPTDPVRERGLAILRCIHGKSGREIFETDDRAIALAMLAILDEIADPLMERHPRTCEAAARRAESLRAQIGEAA